MQRKAEAAWNAVGFCPESAQGKAGEDPWSSPDEEAVCVWTSLNVTSSLGAASESITHHSVPGPLKSGGRSRPSPLNHLHKALLPGGHPVRQPELGASSTLTVAVALVSC